MIGSIKHKGLRRLYENGDRRLIRPDWVERCEMILAALEAASMYEEMDQPTFRLHPLRGNFAGLWAVTVRANWRIVFRFDGDTANEIDLMDYHERGGGQMMKNPPHPGKLIRDNIEELNIPVAKVAEAMGVTRSQLHRVISGNSAISAEMAYRLEQAIGSTADFWLRLQTNYDLAQIRQRATSIRVERLRPEPA